MVRRPDDLGDNLGEDINSSSTNVSDKVSLKKEKVDKNNLPTCFKKE